MLSSSIWLFKNENDLSIGMIYFLVLSKYTRFKSWRIFKDFYISSVEWNSTINGSTSSRQENLNEYILLIRYFEAKPHEYAAQIKLAKQITLLVHGGRNWI